MQKAGGDGNARSMTEEEKYETCNEADTSPKTNDYHLNIF